MTILGDWVFCTVSLFCYACGQRDGHVTLNTDLEKSTHQQDSSPVTLTVSRESVNAFLDKTSMPIWLDVRMRALTLDQPERTLFISKTADWTRLESIVRSHLESGHFKQGGQLSLPSRMLVEVNQVPITSEDSVFRLLLYLSLVERENRLHAETPSKTLLRKWRWYIPLKLKETVSIRADGYLVIEDGPLISPQSQYSQLGRVGVIINQWRNRLRFEMKGRPDSGQIIQSISDSLNTIVFVSDSSQTIGKQPNIPDARRLLKKLDDLHQTIEVNLERYRWMDHDNEPERIEINIPQCALRYYQKNQCVHEAKVIVGKASTPTVVFKASLNRIIQNPYWYVPASITRNEILPMLSKRRHYLQQHNMEWYLGGIRQKPGVNNALGLLKFEFDNPYSIYLHDTPSKALFKQKKRFFSHGCIRLENPSSLANKILRNQLMDTIHSEEKNTIVRKLHKAIPVYVVYFTAWVGDNGKLQIADDWYKKDQLLKTWLVQKWQALGLAETYRQ